MRIITICGFLAMSVILSLGRVIIDTADRAAHFVGDLCLDALRADYGNAVSVDRWVLSAFRVIGLLKPEYDESLESDGQNFERDVRLASHC